MSKFRPQIRGGFSDRNGIRKLNTTVQVDSFEERTRNGIMNLIDSIIKNILYYSSEDFYSLFNHIYLDVFGTTDDSIPLYTTNNYELAREPIFAGITVEWDYDEILSFLEDFLEFIDARHRFKENYYDSFNNLFKKEYVGYRFIDGVATRIINDEEIASIEKAFNTKYSACNKCIEKSIKLLYDKSSPDYENSVKESISAIEAMCNIINGTEHDTLGDALNKLEKNGVVIHGALKNAFNALYGYTSDKNGIRHNAGISEKTTFEEAQFMLISCSAFLNYLIEIYEH